MEVQTLCFFSETTTTVKRTFSMRKVTKKSAAAAAAGSPRNNNEKSKKDGDALDSSNNTNSDSSPPDHQNEDPHIQKRDPHSGNSLVHSDLIFNSKQEHSKSIPYCLSISARRWLQDFLLMLRKNDQLVGFVTKLLQNTNAQFRLSGIVQL